MKNLFKKSLTVILALLMITNFFCVNISAAEDSKEKRRLGAMLNYLEVNSSSYGDYSAYYSETWNDYSLYTHYKQVYDDIASTNDDYTKAYAEILEEKYSNFVRPSVAILSVSGAENEKNYNNWYSDEEWNKYQLKIKALREAVGNYSAYSNHQYNTEEMKKITYAFHDWLYTLNTMTNKDYIKGDVDKDGKVTINDATMVQRALSGRIGLTTAQKMRARAVLYNRPLESKDSMGRYVITINDVTQIQKFLAGDTAASDAINNTPFDYGKRICIFVDELESLEDQDYLMGHFLNYFVCPRTLMNYPSFQKNYYLGSDWQSVYRICKDTIGIDYRI